MSNPFRGLLRHTIVYGLGGVAQRFIGFLLIPLYTRYLAPADYGELALAALIMAGAQQILVMGMPSAMTRWHILVHRDEVEQKTVVRTGAWSLMIQSVVIGVSLALLARPLAAVVFGEVDGARFYQPEALIYLMAASAPFYAVETLRNTLFRIHERSRAYAIVALAGFLLNVLLSITFVVGYGLGAFGVILAQVLTMAVVALAFIPWLVRALLPPGRIRGSIWREMASYGIPLVPSGLATWGLDLMNSYLLRVYRPMAEVGLYSLGYRFGMIMVLILMAFRLAWPQVMFTQAAGDEQRAKHFFSRALTFYVAGMSFIALGVAALAGDLLRLLTPETFHAAAGVVPLIALAYTVQGSFIILEAGIDVKKRTGFIPLFTGLAALANLGLNLLLIPEHGMYGAAAATAISFLIVPTGYYIVNQWLYPIRFQWGRIALISLLAVALFFGTREVATGHALADLGIRCSLVLLHPALLLAFPLLPAGTRSALSGLVRQSLGRA